jgi:anti-sigma-K factor RskA
VTHEEVRDLLGAYVLDALSRDEHSAVEAHLRTCAGCRVVVQELEPVQEQLGLLAEELEPPPALRVRLLAIAEQERHAWLQAQAPSSPAPSGIGSPVSTAGGTASRNGTALEGAGLWSRLQEWVRGTPRLALGGAAALVVVIIAAGVILATRPALTVRTYACAALQPAVNGVKLADTGCTVGVRSDHTIDLAFTSLPALSTAKAYELWALPAKGNPVPIAGITNTHRGAFQHIYQVDARKYPKAAISIERAPGDSAVPHGPVIFVLPLTS